ncbi:hypothetical protein D3822_31940, partial [Escherichia coli]
GKFNLLDIRRHTMSKTFSIKTTKSQNDQCTDGFKVSSSFYTEETLVEEDKANRSGWRSLRRLPYFSARQIGLLAVVSVRTVSTVNVTCG